jgi:Zn-dependent peptidase ImmA (M78 family)/transcriptional regulator with XRE-family HTH domain
MSAAHEALVTAQVVRWARERARMGAEKVATKLKRKPEDISAWETGKAFPTMRQAERLAEILHIPLGYLFLPAPPEEKLPLPDFRTIGSAIARQASAELMDLLNDVIGKQQWYREFLLQAGREPQEFVGSFSLNDSAARIATSISTALRIDHDLRKVCNTPDEFLRKIIRNAEVLGILVMRSGVVAGHTRRPLSVEEFRGFAISDPIAPLVFVNAKDSQHAQIFTFVHELAHIWIGASGISDENLKRPSLGGDSDIERICNATAAEVLVPQADFLRTWLADRDTTENMRSVVTRYRVSSLVALRRAYDLHKISWDEYLRRYKAEESRFRNQKVAQKKGGDFFNNLFARNSEALTAVLVRGAIEGRVLYRDAAYLLNVNVPVIAKIASRLEKRRERT